MSSRIAVNQFGSSVTGSRGNELNLYHTDKLYVNKSGDTMTGDLNMEGNKITNVGNPTLDKDCATKVYVDTMTVDFAKKAYVDGQIAASNNLLNVALMCVKFKLILGSTVDMSGLGNAHQFDHNFFVQGVWYLSIDRQMWYDSQSDACKKLKVDFRTDGSSLTIHCKNTTLPTDLTGDGVLLLKQDISTAYISISLCGEPSWLRASIAEARQLDGQ